MILSVVFWGCLRFCQLLSGDFENLDSKDQSESHGADFWTISGDMLVRVHCEHRIALFYPDSSNCPLRLNWLGIQCAAGAVMGIVGMATMLTAEVDGAWRQNTTQP